MKKQVRVLDRDQLNGDPYVPAGRANRIYVVDRESWMSPLEKGARDGRRPMRIIEDCSDGGRLPRSGFVQQGGPQGTTYSGAGSKDVAYFLVLYLGMVQCSLSGDPITATLCVERLFLHGATVFVQN